MPSFHPLTILRALYGWTQQQLALEAGVAISTIVRNESGKTTRQRRRTDSDMKFANAFGLSLPEYLQFLEGKVSEKVAQKISEKAAKQEKGQQLTADEVQEFFQGLNA